MSAAAALYYDTRTDHDDFNARPAKKLKIEKSQSLPGRLEVEAETTIIPPHPLGIKPSGNAYTAPSNLKYASGLFAILPDDLLIEVLEFLDKSALLSLGNTCKALYAFASFEELWKTLFIKYVLHSFTCGRRQCDPVLPGGHKSCISLSRDRSLPL